MHLAPLIHDLALILGVAALVTFVFQRIRQPVVLGYVIAGLIVGPHAFPFGLVRDLPDIRIWAELGVIFLMFSLGLEFSFRKLARVGVSTGLTACFEVGCMFALGYAAGRMFGWSLADSWFLAAMVSISSTTIIIKALDELNLKTRRFSELVFGILIVEDLAAILMLVALSTAAGSRQFSSLALLASAGKLVLVIGSWFLAGYLLLPRFVRYVGRVGNDEMLTILSIGLCLLLVVVASYFGYSTALGAFIMGSILAESTESLRIEELIRPLKDMFAAVFFVTVGMLIDPHSVWTHLGTIAVITGLVIGGKILFATLGTLLTGQTLRTAIQVGFGLGQIGEFSFIIVALGVTLGVVSDFLYPVAVAVSVITTFISPYLIRSSHDVAVRLESALSPAMREFLTRYAAWSQTRRADAVHRAMLYRLSFRWILNGLTMTVVFIVTAEFLLPPLKHAVGSRALAAAIGWAAAVLLSSPFLWGMFSSFRNFHFEGDRRPTDAPRGGTLFASRLFAIIWVGSVSLAFFPARYALVITAVLAGALLVRFYRQLETSYNWFERNFLATFEPAAKSHRRTDVARMLAPWDAHLVRIKVHPNSEIAGQRLVDAGLRSKYGLSVIAVQRGSKTVVGPKADFPIFPKDELLVLGSDEQTDLARDALEKPAAVDGDGAAQGGIEGYQLRGMKIGETSPLLGRTVRDSGLRQNFSATVVGVERQGRRVLNPPSDLVFEKDDTVWVVGENDRMETLLGESVGNRT